MASIFSHFLVVVMLALTQTETLTAEEKSKIESTKSLKPVSVLKTENVKSWNKRSTSNGKALNAIRQAVARGGFPAPANPLDNSDERYWSVLQIWLRDNGYPLTAANTWRRRTGPKSRVTREIDANDEDLPDKKDRLDTWNSMNTWGKRSPNTWDSMAAWGKRNPNTWDSMSAWGKRNGDTWDSMSAWGKRNGDTWDSMSAWGKRNGDTWDSMSAWGKRNPNTWDSMSAWGKRNGDTWDSMSAWGKRGADTWDSMSAWGKRGDDTWDSMSAWGKRNGESGNKRDWDSLQSWGKRGKNKKDWDSLAAWGKRDIAGTGNEEIGSQVQSLMKRSSGKNAKSRR